MWTPSSTGNIMDVGDVFVVLLCHEGIYDVPVINPVVTDLPNLFRLHSQDHRLKRLGLHLELIQFLFRIRTAASAIAKMTWESHE